MNAIAEFTISPLGVGVSLSKYVALCEQILDASDLSYELHANGTDLEGDWNEVLDALKTCHEKLHTIGVPRIATQIKIGTRTDREQKMEDEIQSVQSVLEERKEDL